MILTIEAATADELRSKVMGLAGAFGLTDVPVKIDHHARSVSDEAPMPIPPEVLNAPTVGVNSTDAPKKRPGRPKSEKTALTTTSAVEHSPPKAAVESEVESKPAESAGPSKAEVLAALQDVNNKKGLPIARELLKKFGAERISELKAENYPAFISEAKMLAA